MRFLSLFAGIGGLDLGLERAGWECVAQVEWDDYCQLVLAKHWPNVPRWRDIRHFDATPFRGRVDAVVGGFPCQPFSVAGKQKGHEDDRYLWPEMLRVVRECGPRWVVAENVPGIRTIAADRVIEELHAEGYAVWPLVVGADDCGAPHRRKRVFFVARLADPHGGPLRDGEQRMSGRRSDGVRDEGASLARGGDEGELAHGASGGLGVRRDASRPGRGGHAAGGDEGELAHRDSGGRERGREPQPCGIEGARGDESDGCGERWSGSPLVHPPVSGLEGHGSDAGEPEGSEPRRPSASLDDPNRAGQGIPGEADAGGGFDGEGAGEGRPAWLAGHRWPSRPGEPQYEWEAPRLIESGLGEPASRLPRGLAPRDRRARLKALGNAVVPQVAEAIGRAILEARVKP